MVEVTRSNFQETLPLVQQVIDQCSFFAIDSEFTGLESSSATEKTLFDSPEERYIKLKQNAEAFTISQFGLACYSPQQQDIQSNKYTAHVFNFFLLPRPVGNLDPRFKVQVSSIEFLCQNSFDFNKYFYGGIPYLNETIEEELRREYQMKLKPENIQDVELMDHSGDRLMAIIKEWRDKNLILHQQSCLDLKTNPSLSLGDFIQQIHAQFPDVHAYVNADGRLIVKLNTRNTSNNNQEMNWANTIQHYIGFSHVFKMLVKSRKPMVGHNLMMDIMLMYNHFYQPLPPTLVEFKRNMLKLFNPIIDTKQLCVFIRKEYNVLNDTSLSEVYKQLTSNQWSLFSLCSPDVNISNSNIKKVTLFHEAGNDAYSAGFVFLRIGHFLYINGKSSREAQPAPFATYLHLMKKFENRINVIRGTIDYYYLAGPDPPSNRPKWFVVTPRRSTFLPNEVLHHFYQFGSADVKILSNKRAIVAVSSRGSFKDVVRYFNTYKGLNVRTYSKFWDSDKTVYTVSRGAFYALSTTLALSSTTGIIYGIYWLLNH
ncbi:Poly(A)-specific ribonuclease PARN-like domain-containing protein 1 [Oopsacas minuta]|uniref:Poly(A)-specific ribonuclease PARN-like domain-containing protein 1 n=1 Tax=Oopsacas minuta TaxID=111878 RepID=A0AAV7JDC0_9METZ|nr:Poly(A)-specific ribonuclease PARN-like domain-containing protein 1 [Oopsacas minuta]